MAKTLNFYFDEHMSRKVASQLAALGYRVVMAVDEDMVGKDDLDEHLRFATERGSIMVTCDRPFAGRAMSRSDHAGLICWTGTLDDFGGQIRLLQEFSETHVAEDVAGHVFWIKPQ